MKTKLIICFVSLFFGSIVVGQTANSIVKVEMESMVSGLSQGKTLITTTTYIKGKDMKIESLMSNVTQYQFFIGDKATVVTKEKGSSDLCGEGTRDEWKELSEGTGGAQNKTEYEDVKVKKTNKTMKLLGYECKKANISYKVSTMGFKMKSENEIWYTDALKVSESETGDPSNMGVSNAYSDALNSLGGVTLKITTKVNGMQITQMTITEIRSGGVEDNMLSIKDEAKECKKMLTLKEHNKKVEERNAARDAQNRQMQNQMNQMQNQMNGFPR